MTQLATPKFLMKFPNAEMAQAWLSGVLAGIVVGGSDNGLLGYKVGNATGVDVDVENYEEGDYLPFEPSSKMQADAQLVEVKLLLDLESDDEAYDWVNETFREMAVKFKANSSLLDYEITVVEETEARSIEEAQPA